MTVSESARFRERKLTLVAIDLAGFTRASTSIESSRLALFVDGFYAIAGAAVDRAGGRVVKFMGDACFAVFAEEACAAAIDCVLEIGREFAAWNDPIARQLGVGANVHISTVTEGEFGPERDRRYDVIGAGVNYVFRMGGGRGVRISEPAYRQLPNERRGPWKKQKPPSTYTLD